jgi:hypothetical protein
MNPTRNTFDSLIVLVWKVFAIVALIAALMEGSDRAFAVGLAALIVSLLYEIRSDVRESNPS